MALPTDGGYLRVIGKVIPLFLWTGMAGFLIYSTQVGFMISSSAIITDKTQRNPLIFMQTGNVRHCPLTYRIILSRLNI